MPSQAAAAAVTDDVSFTAVPANRPKPSLLMPSMAPSEGKISAAMMLKRKMTLMAWAISSSSASMTGAVAAIAEPPQIEEPTPTSVEIFLGMCSARHSTNEMTSDVVMVEMMMGRELAPTLAISPKLRPKPSRMTAYCRIFFDVYLMPAEVASTTPERRRSTRPSAMPMRMAKTGPPMTSNCLPSSHAGTEMTNASATPRHRSLKFLKSSMHPTFLLIYARDGALAAPTPGRNRARPRHGPSRSDRGALRP